MDRTRDWIWQFAEPDGGAADATVAIAPNGVRAIGYDADQSGVAPEQFILDGCHQVS